MERLKNFNSSSIRFAAYDAKKKILQVGFAGNDEVYEYARVPPGKWKALKEADSKGRYINFEIKPYHDCTIK